MPLNIDWQQILLHAFNFIILAAGLTFLLFKPVRKFMQERQEKYRKTAEEHARKQAELSQLDEEKNAKIASMDSELESHRKEFLAQTEARNQHLIDEAETQAQTILTESRKKAEEEKAAFFSGAEREIADMVVNSAAKLLAVNSSPESDSALYDSYLKTASEDISIEGISQEARQSLAGRLALISSRGEQQRKAELGRADLAEMLGGAALEAIKRESSPEGDSALYDEFLKTVKQGGKND